MYKSFLLLMVAVVYSSSAMDAEEHEYEPLKPKHALTRSEEARAELKKSKGSGSEDCCINPLAVSCYDFGQGNSDELEGKYDNFQPFGIYEEEGTSDDESRAGPIYSLMSAVSRPGNPNPLYEAPHDDDTTPNPLFEPILEPVVVPRIAIELPGCDYKHTYKKAKNLAQAIATTQRIISEAGIAPHEVRWIFDVDGTLNNHPDPSKVFTADFRQRENSVARVREIMAQGGHVTFCSAWVEPNCLSPELNEKMGITSTVRRLKAIGFTDYDLGMREGEQPQECTLVLTGGLIKYKSLKAYRCGHVVSCHSPTREPTIQQPYFRGKLFAAAISTPELCPSTKAVVLIDDGIDNCHRFIKDLKHHNPYGAESVLPIVILLQ